MFKTNVSLKAFNTFGLDITAERFFSFQTIKELDDFMQSYHGDFEEILILGGGSNVLFSKNYPGLVIHPDIKYIRKIDESNREILFEVGSGVIWDDFVKFAVQKGYYGCENMSLIPGNIGATAVQNAGAYGTESKDLIVSVMAYDLYEKKELVLSNEDCKFEYRNSIFKTENFKNRILITSIIYKLSKISKYRAKLDSYSGNALQKQYRYWKDFIGHLAKSIRSGRNRKKSFLDYRILKNLLEDSGLLPLWLKRRIVIRTRTSKLPDIAILGNVGSFFKNPIIPASKAESLKKKYPDIVLFPYTPGYIKVSAAWLIDKCGWSGKRIGGASTLKHLPLTIVNHGDATSEDIIALAKGIEMAVETKFGVVIEKEVVQV